MATKPPGVQQHPQPAAAVARWRLRLLGAFELDDGRSRLTRLPSRAVTLLLARLAMGLQREHGREELVDLLWPAVPLEVGRNRLRQALSALRSVLEPAEWAVSPVLVADRRTVRLVPGALSCDVWMFEAALREGDTAAAARLFRGDLLPGFFDEWVIDERRRLGALAEGLAMHPVRAGRMGGAADAAAAPALPTPAVAAVPSHRLPSYLTRKLGFEAAGASLALAVHTKRLVVLRGPGGGGKTRLAIGVARSLAAEPSWANAPRPAFDLIVFVPLVACEVRQAFHDAVLLALRQDGTAGAGRTTTPAALPPGPSGRWPGAAHCWCWTTSNSWSRWAGTI